MKKLFVGLNKAGLAAILIAGGLVISQSAFTPRVAPNYSRNPSTGVWSPLTASEGELEGQYQCLEQVSTYCTGYFSSPNPAPNATPTSEARTGNFVIND